MQTWLANTAQKLKRLFMLNLHVCVLVNLVSLPLTLISESASLVELTYPRGQVLRAPSEAWQFLPVRVRIRQKLATSLTPITHSGG